MFDHLFVKSEHSITIHSNKGLKIAERTIAYHGPFQLQITIRFPLFAFSNLQAGLGSNVSSCRSFWPRRNRSKSATTLQPLTISHSTCHLNLCIALWMYVRIDDTTSYMKWSEDSRWRCLDPNALTLPCFQDAVHGLAFSMAARMTRRIRPWLS